jgi:uncharacterized protein (DUF1810 family)
VNALVRFKEAQDPVWTSVIDELTAGLKTGHWSWFVFPQLRGLGHSAMSFRFGIESLQEARDYWRHPVLGSRLRQCIGLLMDKADRSSVTEVLGAVDAMKFRSCLTLFERACPEEPLFARAIELLCEDQRDPVTLDLLGTGT